MTTQILIWWLVVQVLGLAGLPPARFLFRALPDRGYAFAKTLGLLLTGYLAWLVAMLGLAPFGAGLLVVSALAVGAGGLLVARRGTTDDRTHHTARFSVLSSRFLPWLRENWRMILGYEALFLLALIFLALLRSYNPDPWGTERPMDYALFNAIRRSASFPPHDPWLSGYSINYYYFGYLLMAVMALLSGLEPAVAYNLSLALIFALTALGVAGVVFNLIALTLKDDRRPTTDDRQKKEDGRWKMEDSGVTMFLPLSSILHPHWWSVVRRLLAIVLAVVLVLFAANQGGALEVITGTNMAVALEGPDLQRAITNGLGPREPLYLQKPFVGDYFSGTAVITPTNMIEQFDWWQPSRAVWDSYTRDGQTTRHYTITEFPFFSFWLGDMHPHVMALPFGLLALALAIQTIARPAAPAFALGRRGRLELALTGIVLGSLYAINSWDFPTYLLMFLGALLLLYARLGTTGDSATDPSTPLDRIWWRHYLGQAVMAALASVIMFAPFYLTFRSLVGGREPLVNLPIFATITRTLGFVTQSRTPIHSFLTIFGLFLLPLVVYVFAQGHRQRDQETRRPGDKEIGANRAVSWSTYLPWIVLAALVIGPLIGFPLLVLLPLALYAALLAIQRAGRPAGAFALGAFALVCLICFGTEVVYIRDVFEGDLARLNTIFKFYYQAWLIWGVLAGYALWWLATRRPTTDDRRPTTDDRGRAMHYALRTTHYAIDWSLAGLFGGLFVLLLAGALVYPWLTAGKTFREEQRVGLAGKTPREATAAGAASIAWLRANAPRDAVILEAVGGDYSPEGFGGVAAATGLATVMGWPGHEQQWRGGDPPVLAMIGPRTDDVKTIYGTTDVNQARALLAKHKVSYIYVGALERATYPPEGLAKLTQLGEPVFQQDDVTIYPVTNQ